ncbi:MAG: thioredoxin domain-containing protein [Desulfopila sp.]
MTPSSSNSTSSPNALIHEKSPYLQQHAYNPVNWFAWGEEPFNVARRDDKPVFLSIGYSTCHWCHVMEKESFENDDIAKILNEHFVSIKVDREERPDIDQIYMLATQAMSGGGGWPMSVFLFPDKKPFYAGTYFPPEPRYNHPGFPELLNTIARTWLDNRKGLAESAEKLTAFLRKSSRMDAGENLEQRWSENGFQALAESYDSDYHGFGTTNKFPRPCTLDFLLAYHSRTNNDDALSMVEKTLRAMALGGMYDHIGGGFHRYSVDRQWRIPHFEKMLYDQAQLVVSYLQMYQHSGDDFFAGVAEETIEYVLRDLQHPDGGLYSAEDADSINPYDPDEKGEGAFYLWQDQEILDVLDESEAGDFIACYGIRRQGNALADPAGDFSGRNICYLAKPIAETAGVLKINEEELRQKLARARRKLLVRRNSRVRPHLDDKIITAWNGLMMSALAQAGRILDAPAYIDAARRVAEFIFSNLMSGAQLQRRWRDGEARFDGVLEDYAFVIQGLVDLYGATHNGDYLEKAIALTATQNRLFADPDGGFFNSQESADLLTRMKETSDGAEPSGNSVAAMNHLRLGRMLNRSDWYTTGEATIKAFGAILERHGMALPFMLKALEFSLRPHQQLVVCGSPDSEDTRALLRQANKKYNPQLQVLLADGGDNQKVLERYLDSIGAMAGNSSSVATKSTAYVCRNYTCDTPTDSAEELARQLDTI